MKILIDSHVLIWLLYNSSRLSASTKEMLLAASEVYVSSASIWELAIKFTKKKLTYSPDELILGAQQAGLSQLPINAEHLRWLPKIKLLHNDPFDTLLVAQSKAEGCVLMTADDNLLKSKYPTVEV